MFGSPSQFTFGSSTTPATPFGAVPTTTTTAPATTGFLFGSAGTSGAAASPLNSTFTFGTPTANTPAAAPATAFGSTLQNSNTNRPFGSAFTFGTPSSTATSTAGSTGFGGTSLFGTTQTSAPLSMFGSTSTTFGTAQTTPGTSLFGSTAVAGAAQVGTTVKFEPVSGQDSMRTKNNTFQTINTKLQCICAMKEYSNKSMEEFRMEDYQANRKFPTTGSLFGTTTFTSATPFSSQPFGAASTFSTPTTTSSIFGSSTTTTTSPFAVSGTAAPSFAFGTSTAPTSTIFGAPATSTASPFGAVTSTAPATTSLFGTTPATTSIFGSTATTSPFGVRPATAPTTFGFGMPTSTTTSMFGSQPSTTTSLFSAPTTSTPFGTTATTMTPHIFGATTSTASVTPTLNPFGTSPATTNIFGTTTSTAAPVFGAATGTPAFTGFGSTAPTSTTAGIFGTPATSTASTMPVFGGFGTQTATSTASPFTFSTTTSSAPSPFGAAAAAPTTSTIFNPTPFTGFNFSQTAPIASTATQSFGFSTPFGSTTTAGFAAPTSIPQVQTLQPAAQPQTSLIQQRFLAASLLDPFASRGKKDFTNIDQIKPPADLIVVSTSSLTSTTVTTSTSSPVTLPLQSNSRKTQSARPLVDIRFKLKPTVSSPSSTANTLADDLKSPNPPTTPPIGPIKSPLTTDFSEEEELALISKNKMSKLRLSNDLIDSSFQSESVRTLYPLRRLAELETLANMNNNTNILSTAHTIPSTTSTTTIGTASVHASSTTVNNEQTLNPTDGGRKMLPLHHSTPLIVHKQPSPPVSHPSTTLVQSPAPVPPPSTTPPPSTSTVSNTMKGTKITLDHEDKTVLKSSPSSHAYLLPKLTREQYYMKPTLSELKSRFNNKGQCIVNEFTVGHETYGSVTFYDKVDVAGLDLDEIIQIGRHELTVYPDDDNKPPVGKELNVPARITLLGVYPIDRTTRDEITDAARIKAMSYGDYLRSVTKKFDGEFVNYEPTDGSWVFMVKHFTRYGLDGSEDDFVVAKPPQAQKQPPLPPAQQPTNKPIVTNFLDQTVALNDTFPLSSPRSHPMDTEEKENSSSLIQQQRLKSTVPLHNRSLTGLTPREVEQLIPSIFCDDDDDDAFGGFQQMDGGMTTSTKIISSGTLTAPIIHEPLVEKSTLMEQDKTQLTFAAPAKPVHVPVYSRLSSQEAKARGKYFRTNFSHELQYGSIDKLNKARILLQKPMNFHEQTADELDEFFEIYFSSCAQQVDENSDLPRYQIRQDPTVVQRFIEFYTKILDESKLEK